MSLKDIETEFDKLVSWIAPIEESNVKRNQVTSFIRNVVTSQVQHALIVECGSSALKTYLPEGDLDLILFSKSVQLSSSDEMSYLKQVFNALCDEVVSKEDGSSSHGDMVIRNVEFINARTKVTHCVVNNVSIDITVDHSGALISLLYLEEIDREIGLNHLFKRSILLIKVWCTHETLLYCGAPILGAKLGMLSSYAISTLVVHLFNRYDVQLLCCPLAVLRCFLFTYMNFPWETHVLTVAGGVPIVNGGSSAVPSSNGHSAANTVANKFQHVTDRINAVVQARGSVSNGSSGGTPFSLRSCNIQDPMDPSNNLGISVSRVNLGCIERALQMGFSHLESLITALVSASIAAAAVPKPPTVYQQMTVGNSNNSNTNKMRSNSMNKTSNGSGGGGGGGGGGAVNGNNKRHSFTNGSGGGGSEAAMDGVNRTFSPSSAATDSVSDDSSGATTVSSHSSHSLMGSGDGLPPPFPSIEAVSDSESVAGSVSSIGASSYSSVGGGCYPNQHYRQSASNRPVVYQQGDSRYTSPSASGFTVPPQRYSMPHLTLPQPVVLPVGAAVPFLPLTPSNHLHRGGPSPRAPSPSSAATAAPSEAQHVLMRFFPTTLAYYLIDGQTPTALRSDLMEHPLQLNYKHVRPTATSTAPSSGSVEETSVTSNYKGSSSDVFLCNAEHLWKILRTISAPPQSRATPPAAAPPPPRRQSPPSITTIVAPVVAMAPVAVVKEAAPVNGRNTASSPVKELEKLNQNGSGSKTDSDSSTEKAVNGSNKGKKETTRETQTVEPVVFSQPVEPTAASVSSSPSPESVSEPVTVVAAPTPVKPTSAAVPATTIAATPSVGSSKKNKSNVTPTKPGVNGSKSTPAVASSQVIATSDSKGGNKTKSVPSPSSVAGSDSLINGSNATASTVEKSKSSSTGGDLPSNQSKLRLSLKQYPTYRWVLGLLCLVVVYAVGQTLLTYRGQNSELEAQICTSNISDVDRGNLSLSLDDALNSSSQSKSGHKTKKAAVKSVEAASNLTVQHYAVTHWIELNSSITFGDFSRSGFPNYYAQTLLPSLNSSITAATDSSAASVSVSYQWTKDNVNISSARLPYYTVKSAKYSDGGYYRCFVHITRSITVNVTSGTTTATATPSITKSSAGDSGAVTARNVVEKKVVTSVESHLIAESIVYITKEPRVRDAASYQIVRAGTDFVFTLQVEGSPPPTFQWFKNGYIAEGQTNQSISFPNISAEHIGTYSCKVENFAGGYEWKDITIMLQRERD